MKNDILGALMVASSLLQSALIGIVAYRIPSIQEPRINERSRPCGTDDPGLPWTYYSGDNEKSTYRLRDGDYWVYRTYGCGITRPTGMPQEVRIKILEGEK